MTTVLDLNRGSDVELAFVWPDGAGGAADLSDYDVETYDLHSSLVGQITVTFGDASAGEISVVVRWADDIPTDGSAGFRIRLLPKAGFANLLKLSTNKITLRID